jgi:hypothetical protein
MAVSYLFDSTYGIKQTPSGDTGAHRIVIGCTDSVGGTLSELVIYDPGINLQYQGDTDRFSKAIMGSTLSFTARINDSQLATWDTLLNKDEGKVFCLFFNDDDPTSLPYWYGHLVIENAAISISNQYHDVDLSFTDGLASLRGQNWVNDNDGERYTGFKTLEFFLKEIVFKLPAVAGYLDYVENELSTASVPLFSEVGLPWPSSDYQGTFYDWHEDDPILQHLRVKAQTFDKPKKKVDRLREVSPRPDFFSTADVLEDICKTFGAVAVMFNGRVNIACRQEMAFFRGQNVYSTTYDFNRSAQTYARSTSASAYYNTTFDSTYKIANGAVRRRSMPYSQALLVHEDGGSDNLVQYGYFDPRGAAESGGRPNIFTSSGDGLMNTGYRSYIRYVFKNPAPWNELDDLPLDVDEDYLKYPADPSGYLGFPEQTATDIEAFSGENVRLTFGGNVEFRDYDSLTALPTPYAKNMWGGTMVVRVRLEFTTIDDVAYRLSRTVQTHVLSNGSVDYINIDAGEPGSANDRLYFRKLYNELNWIAEGEDGYDDSWYEIMVPHGDTNNTGDDWGASIHALTVPYANQVAYAPMGVKIQGEDDGTGVTLKKQVSDAHMFHYFREDIQLELPYGASDTVLNFDTARFEMGAAMYESDNGPRPNTTGGNNGSPEYDGETPVWRSANADGTGGSKLYSTGAYYMAEPWHIEFVGARVALGDGSESADITTKFKGGSGYEVFDMGSSRLGSRKTFYNRHNAGTLWAPVKTANTAGSFLQAGGQTVYSENLQWQGHNNDEPTYGDGNSYDALHTYVAHSHLQLLGRSADIYSMTLYPHPGANVNTLMSPLLASFTSQLTLSTDTYLIPLNLRWNSAGELAGDFLKVGASRDLSTVQEVFENSSKGSGPIGGQPGHGIVGVIDKIQQSRLDTSTNTTNITVIDGKVTDLNTAKDELELLQLFMEK